MWVQVVGCLPAFWRVHLCRLAGFRGVQDLPELARVLWWCVPLPLVAFLPCAWCIACKYGSISRFKGVFRWFYGVCVGLFGLRVLLGFWGFCARV